MYIKEKDLKIIIELRRNARKQITEISKKTNIPISTIFDRLKIKANGIIKSYKCLIDFDAIGFNTRATICIKCGKTSKDGLRKLFLIHNNVNNFYKINNGYDFMVDVVFKNIKQLEEFIEDLEENHVIKAKQVYYIIEEHFREKFLTGSEHLQCFAG